jgi:acetyl-CoA carboxylase biotin carboxyl carrier protein
MAQDDISYIEAIAKIVTDLDLESVDYNKDNLHIIVTNRGKEIVTQAVVAAPVAAPVTAPTVAAPQAVTEAPAAPTVKGETIKSPMVGVLYLSATPNDPDYVKVGDTVKEGDILCLIEAMKTFNQIKAHKGGVIREILVSSGSAVEFDEPLFVIE